MAVDETWFTDGERTAPRTERPVEAVDPPKRKRGRPSNAERAAREAADRARHRRRDAGDASRPAGAAAGGRSVARPQRLVRGQGAIVRRAIDALTTQAHANGVLTPVFPGVGVIEASYKHIAGGRGTFLEYVGTAVADGHPAARRWFSVFQQLPSGAQQYVAFEDVCVASGVPASELVGLVVATALRHGEEASNITAAAMLPGVVRQLGKSAHRIGGRHASVAQKDRHLFLQSTKFAPVPKGHSTTVNVSANAKASAAAAASSNPSVPSFMQNMRSLTAVKETVQGAIIDATPRMELPESFDAEPEDDGFEDDED